MKTNDLNYYLPEALIAQHPVNTRTASKLMVVDRSQNSLSHQHFSDLPNFLHTGDCLVLNETRVIAARFYLKRQTGGKIEGLFLDITGDGTWHVLLKGANRLKESETVCLTLSTGDGSDYQLKTIAKQNEGHWLIKPLFTETHLTVLAQFGKMPLPPYIHRAREDNNKDDQNRYQTVFAKYDGSVAAPTAGLHFSDDLLKQIQNMGVRIAYVTLHVGLGTFKPITSETIEAHIMHYESFDVSGENAAIINDTLENNRRVIPVGSTAMRTLESVAKNKRVMPQQGETNIYITPGYKFQIASAMITNFHLPKSTLLAMISAFASLEQIMHAYEIAVQKEYRFFSYGDAMFIHN